MTWTHYLKTFWEVGSRYFLLATGAFLVLYILWRKRFYFKKIQLKYPQTKDYRREIFFSIISMGIFSAVPVIFIFNPAVRVHTFYYTDIRQYGMFWFVAAFFVMMLMHDTYFYWTHRLMHQKWLFRFVHLVHHKSTNPSPWAAYSFNPLEAIVEAGIVPLMLFTIPITGYHLSFFFLFMIVYNVYGHLGWELYPKRFSRHWLGKWINTSVNHNQHHQYFKGNYGLYFLFWDRWMGTIRTDYEKQFEEVGNRNFTSASPGPPTTTGSAVTSR